MSVTIEAGPELDRAVAEAIGVRCCEPNPYPCTLSRRDECVRCGVELTANNRASQDLIHCVRCRKRWDEEYAASRLPKPYSTDLNAAFAAAEKVGLFERWMLFQSEGAWYFQDPSERIMHIPTQPAPALAICAAILKLKEE